MKAQSVGLSAVVFVLSVALGVARLSAQAEHGRGFVVLPDSTVEHAEDHGLRAHTNHLILMPDGAKPQSSTPTGKTAASLYPVYLPGASYSTALGNGSGTIAIVDAYDYPTAENDLNVFSSTLGLPACTSASGCFLKVYASGRKPSGNCSWNQEAALDIEWAHAMAPGAKIVLVEAASSSFNDLFTAVKAATQQVKSGPGGVGEVSMSWGGSEFSGETADDVYFQNSGVVYFASSGDTGGVSIYPSASPYVVAAGGTTLNLSGGTFVSETGWSDSGGGPSKYEKQLSYQFGVAGASTTKRSIPDFSFDADPNTGVSVYDTTACQGYVNWMVFGGTSVASPSLAGIVNRSGSFNASSINELSELYSNRSNTADFYDVKSGKAGSYSAGTGWDYVTGIGSSRGTFGK